MFPKTKTYTITFKNREQFNEFTNIKCTLWFDECVSDMILLFESEEDMVDCEMAILMNHIRPNEYKKGIL